MSDIRAGFRPISSTYSEHISTKSKQSRSFSPHFPHFVALFISPRNVTNDFSLYVFLWHCPFWFQVFNVVLSYWTFVKIELKLKWTYAKGSVYGGLLIVGSSSKSWDPTLLFGYFCSLILSDFHSVGVSGPLRSVRGPWDVIYILKAMTHLGGEERGKKSVIFLTQALDMAWTRAGIGPFSCW